ncbi:Zinc finger protein like [Actinidia chinensis var. chinensis]|uniref:Zinc finger protein like n=1 Tax=Actinidia chinensis var. chinensis TaxID=1590841 RepID=A0A2R6R929_ACTCC|nr:Zinc finger protein like [Actinidia chinensis var. chinensis]
MELIHEDSYLKQKEDECLELVMEKGSELLSVLKTVDFELHVQEPFFTQLKDGLKTVEGRCAVGNYNRIASGSLILFNKCLVLQVQDVHRYASFSEMFGAGSLTKVLPGVETIEEGVQIYRKFYSEEKERSNGVLAIVVTKPAAQPFISLASMLSGLSYGGLQRLLGFVHTGGTTGEALPPPRSTLLSSFLLPHNPDV